MGEGEREFLFISAICVIVSYIEISIDVSSLTELYFKRHKKEYIDKFPHSHYQTNVVKHLLRFVIRSREQDF